MQVSAALDQEAHRLRPAVHGSLLERGKVAPAARVDGHAGVEERLDDVRSPEQCELAEDPPEVVPTGVAERARRRLRQEHGLTARDRQHGLVDGIELGGGATRPQQLVGSEMAAAGRQGERTSSDVPPVPRQVRVRACVEQHRKDRQAAAAANGVVEAATGIDVDPPIEKPLQPADVLEVELVVTMSSKPGS